MNGITLYSYYVDEPEDEFLDKITNIIMDKYENYRNK